MSDERDLSFQVPHDRPEELSDPFSDNTPESLRELVDKPDAKLTWSDYQILLGPHLPAGTYEETVYFLPLAFRRLTEVPDEALDLVTAVFGYASKNVVHLEKDGVLTDVRTAIEACFSTWTSDFQVLHFDYVANTEVVNEGLEDLVRFETLSDLAVRFVQSIARSTDATQQSWYLELLRNSVERDVYRPPKHPEITRQLTDGSSIRVAIASMERLECLQDASPNYWPNTLELLKGYCESLE